MKFPGVVAVLCVVPSGLVLHIGITSCKKITMKNNYEITISALELSYTYFSPFLQFGSSDFSSWNE